MSYPKKLLRLRPSQGIVSDIPAHEVGANNYTTGRNIHFRDGFASRVLGSRSVYGTLPNNVFHMLNAPLEDKNYWLMFGANSISALETSHSNLVFSTANVVSQPWQWSSALLNGLPVVTNGLDLPKYWAGDVGTPFATLPGWPAATVCRSLAVLRYHIFALDIDGPSGTFNNKLMWSDATAPGTVPGSWTIAANTQAGDVVLSDTPGGLLCAAPSHGSLLIYKRGATYVADYVGGNDKFAFRPVFTSSGALNRHSVCDVNGQHFVVTDGDIILTDGTNRQSVGQARMRNFLFNQLDQTHYENLFTVYNRAKNEVWTCFPEAGSANCTLALVYDVGNDAFGVRELPSVTCAAVGGVTDTAVSEAWNDDSGTWDSDSSPWNLGSTAVATESLVFGFGTTAKMQDTTDSTSANASIGKYDITFGEPERVKFVRRLHIRASNYTTLFVRVGSRSSPAGPITWSNEVTLTAPEQIVNTFAQGRYISVEVRSSDTSTWVLTGIDIEAELRGYY